MTWTLTVAALLELMACWSLRTALNTWSFCLWGGSPTPPPPVPWLCVQQGADASPRDESFKERIFAHPRSTNKWRL